MRIRIFGLKLKKITRHYGDEGVFGGGKSLRVSMGQNGNNTSIEGVLDTVITNVMIIDYTGIVKADIGIKDGRIIGIGKAGNPNYHGRRGPGYDYRRRNGSVCR